MAYRPISKAITNALRHKKSIIPTVPNLTLLGKLDTATEGSRELDRDIWAELYNWE